MAQARVPRDSELGEKPSSETLVVPRPLRLTASTTPPRRDTPPAFAVPRPTPARDRATLTALRGINAGESFTLHSDETLIGRDDTAHIKVEDNAVSRLHARIGRGETGGYYIEDLGSTNGTFVGTRTVRRTTLAAGDRISLGPNIAFRFALRAEDEDTLQRRIYRASTRDPLTLALNRQAFDRLLALEVMRAQERQGDASLLMLDIDHFKRVNDTFGHGGGDQILRSMGEAIPRVLRRLDAFARFGGEEFAILCRDTGRVDACDLAARVHANARTWRVPIADTVATVTLSVGVASLSETNDYDGSTLLALADRRLYAAKSSGRDRVCADG